MAGFALADGFMFAVIESVPAIHNHGISGGRMAAITCWVYGDLFAEDLFGQKLDHLRIVEGITALVKIKGQAHRIPLAGLEVRGLLFEFFDATQDRLVPARPQLVIAWIVTGCADGIRVISVGGVYVTDVTGCADHPGFGHGRRRERQTRQVTAPNSLDGIIGLPMTLAAGAFFAREGHCIFSVANLRMTGRALDLVIRDVCLVNEYALVIALNMLLLCVTGVATFTRNVSITDDFAGMAAGAVGFAGQHLSVVEACIGGHDSGWRSMATRTFCQRCLLSEGVGPKVTHEAGGFTNRDVLALHDT